MTGDPLAADFSFGDDRHPEPDAQGQAAVLLVESLIHGLLDNGTLTKQQVIEAIDSAMQVKAESAGEQKEPEHTLRKSLALLTAMKRSIEAHRGPYRPAAQPAS